MDFLGGLLPLALLVVAVGALLLAVAVVSPRGRRPSSGRVIRVVGVGSAGASAVEAMMRDGVKGVEFIVVNTDVRALRHSSARRKLAIGSGLTHGRGTGGDSQIGAAAARDASEEIGQALAGSDLVMLLAGLGGGTGSGALPVIAEIARQQDALTMAVVSTPFAFEGERRRGTAERAVAVLTDKVDAVATIPNDGVRDLTPADVTLEDAFWTIDDVLRRHVGEIVDLVSLPGRINVDFADLRNILQGAGAAAIGFGRAGGENRAAEAARQAAADMRRAAGAEGQCSVLVNVAGARALKLSEVDAVSSAVLGVLGEDVDVVFGVSLDRRLQDEVRVTLVATGFDASDAKRADRDELARAAAA